jgi:hypothetical protein
MRSSSVADSPPESGPLCPGTRVGRSDAGRARPDAARPRYARRDTTR